MPVYLVSRSVGGFSKGEVRAGMEREKKVSQKLPGVRWIRSYYSAEEGKIYCEYEAPSVEMLLEHQRRAGIPVEKAAVVQRLEPSMFW